MKVEQLLTHEKEWIRNFADLIMKRGLPYSEISLVKDPFLSLGEALREALTAKTYGKAPPIRYGLEISLRKNKRLVDFVIGFKEQGYRMRCLDNLNYEKIRDPDEIPVIPTEFKTPDEILNFLKNY